MLILSFFLRWFGNPTSGGVPTACPVQGGPGCPLWGDGTVWGDGSLWCSNIGTPYEFVAEKEVHGHRLSVLINFTYCFTPGVPEAFKIHEVRARLAQDRHAEFTSVAYIDGTTPSERLSVVVNYDSPGDEIKIYNIFGIIQRKKHQPKG